MNYSGKVLVVVILAALTVSACTDQSTLELTTDSRTISNQEALPFDVDPAKQALMGMDRPDVLRKDGIYNGCPADGTTGEAVFRGFSNPYLAELYAFSGSAGDAIDIEVHRLTSAMDPVLILFEGTIPSGGDVFTLSIVGSADDNNGIPHGVGGSFADPKLTMALPTTGDYTLAVWDYAGAGPGPTTPYEIHTVGISCSLTVEFDVKPDDSNNVINSKSKGVIPTAILSTADFDASSVDVSTLVFGPGGASEAHGKGHAEDVNGDGLMDVVLHFGTKESGLTSADAEACVSGATTDETPLSGCDAVSVK